MAAVGENKCGFYAVLGLKKECTQLDLRNAYKKLAMKWHPDRCSASGNPAYVEEAKKKFQVIQEAYSVLSDANKRFLYDVGVYDCNDDDDENGMGDFLNEMVSMMSQTKQNENRRNESFEDLQQLFEEIFQSDKDALGSSGSQGCSNKRNSSDMSASIESTQFEGFSIGAGGHQGNVKLGRERRQGSNRRGGRKQKVSSGEDVSSTEYSSISAT